MIAVCREKSVGKLAEFEGRIDIVPGATDDREVIATKDYESRLTTWNRWQPVSVEAYGSPGVKL